MTIFDPPTTSFDSSLTTHHHHTSSLVALQEISSMCIEYLLTRMLVDPAADATADRVGNLVTVMWDYSLGLVVNLILIGRHAEELDEKMKRLYELRKDLKNQAEQEARRIQGAEETQQLSGWKERMTALAKEISRFQRNFGDRSLCISGFCLGLNAVELLRKVSTLTEEGENLRSNGGLVTPRGPVAVQPVPSENSSTTLVGVEELLKRIKCFIEAKDVGVIGVCGMGGAGKTSLLQVINNEFLMGSEASSRAKYGVAIWVRVSREAKDIPTIQKTIANRLGLLPDAPTDNTALFAELSKRRFILFLDDMWEKLDLVEIGVPLPKNLSNNSKIFFTTRYEGVCREMDADEVVKVGSLDPERSWELFNSKLGKSDARRALDNDPVIKELAKDVVARCGGLPISLVTVGRAMATRAKTPRDWRDAIIKLDHRPAEVCPEMEKEVLQCLKFSYEMLRSKTLQGCLLYFALFPEDTFVEKKEIIDYWMCEGFLDFDDYDDVDIEDTRQKGYNLISELQDACLLEVNDDVEWFLEPVRLHDTVRDMALWIAGHEFQVLAGSNCVVSQVPKVETWQKATRISLIDNEEIEEPPSSCWNLSCPNLTTLLLEDSKFARNIPHDKGFFTCTSMSALRVLDLSWVGLKGLPIGITSLISLQYLSLKNNKLTFLPVELGNLVNLRQLILRDNIDLLRNPWPIPREALSRLSNLKVLDMMSQFQKRILKRPELDVLNNLKSLRELHLRDHVCSWELLEVIVESPVLRRCIRNLNVGGDRSPPPMGETISLQIHRLSKWIMSLRLQGNRHHPVKGELVLYSDQLQHLNVLEISRFIEAKISIIGEGVSSHFPKLRELTIYGCDCYELTWIGGLPCLEYLNLADCKNLTEILPDENEGDDQTAPLFFPKVKEMFLKNLPLLRNIGKCPSLETLLVRRCPQLNTAHICESKVWWNGLE